MTAPEIKNLRSVEIVTKEHILAASRLTRLYCRVPYRNRLIERKIRSEPCEAYLLSDTIEKDENSIVGFALFEPVNYRTEDDGDEGQVKVFDIQVSKFALEPWYSTEVGANWVSYNLDKIYERNRNIPAHKREAYIKYYIWDVDELNQPLIDELVKLGYYVADYSSETEIITFMK